MNCGLLAVCVPSKPLRELQFPVSSWGRGVWGTTGGKRRGRGAAPERRAAVERKCFVCWSVSSVWDQPSFPRPLCLKESGLPLLCHGSPFLYAGGRECCTIEDCRLCRFFALFLALYLLSTLRWGWGSSPGAPRVNPVCLYMGSLKAASSTEAELQWNLATVWKELVRFAWNIISSSCCCTQTIKLHCIMGCTLLQMQNYICGRISLALWSSMERRDVFLLWVFKLPCPKWAA